MLVYGTLLGRLHCPWLFEKATAFGTREIGGDHWARLRQVISWFSITGIRWIWKNFGLGVGHLASRANWRLFQ